MTRINDPGILTETDLANVQYTIGIRADGTDVKIPGTLLAGSEALIYAQPNAAPSTNDTGSYATLSNGFVLARDIAVHSLFGQFNNATIGNVYNMFIATVDSSGNITGTVATGTAFTTTATGSQTHEFALSSPVTLTAGTAYIIALVITSGTGTTGCRAFVTSSSHYPNVPEDFALKTSTFGANTKRFWYAQNSDAPSSASPSSSSTSSQYQLGFLFSF